MLEQLHSKNLINGEWLTPNGGEHIVKNPSNTNEVVGILHLSSASHVLDASSAARKALREWADTIPPKRGEMLYSMASALEQRLDDVARVASLEMGKPISEMRGEVVRGINLLRYYAAEGVRSVGSVVPASQSRTLQYTKRVPLGVVGIVTPWNFPVAIPIWKIAPALLCGNTVVWKPAEIASLTATCVAQIFHDAGLPAGVLNLVIGKGREIGDVLIEQAEIDGISFTGSTVVGMNVASKAASRNIKYQTEMGGKNAAIVLADADLPVAVSAILSGAFRSAGQKCTATSRVIVEKPIYDAFTELLRTEMNQLYVGSAMDAQSYLGPVSSAEQYSKVNAYVQMAIDSGEIVSKVEPKVDPASGYYISPIVAAGVDASHPLVSDEIFGPVSTLLQAEDFDHAIELCNQTVYGLSAAIFTRNLNQGLRFLDEAEAGMVRINQETAGVEYQAPFGGMKMSSSHSREQGQSALDFYSQIKTCAVYYG